MGAASAVIDKQDEFRMKISSQVTINKVYSPQLLDVPETSTGIGF
jgi:hypothetical protein